MTAMQIITLACRMNIAQRERMRAIRRARRDHPSARLVVTGCAAEIDRTEIGVMVEVDALGANAANRTSITRSSTKRT